MPVHWLSCSYEHKPIPGVEYLHLVIERSSLVSGLVTGTGVDFDPSVPLHPVTGVVGTLMGSPADKE